MAIPIYVTLIRLLVPLSILIWPLAGIMLSSLADMYDWILVNLVTEKDYQQYQNWDKLMDLYYWVFALVVTIKWKDILAKRLAFGFFAYRIIGMLLFWISGKRIFLFLFPNFFENFFIFYLLFTLFFKKTKLLTSGKITFIVLSVIIIPKLIHEYFMHFLEKQPWELYNIGGFFGFSGLLEEYTNYLTFGSLLYLFPFIFGLILANKLQSKK